MKRVLAALLSYCLIVQPAFAWTHGASGLSPASYLGLPSTPTNPVVVSNVTTDGVANVSIGGCASNCGGPHVVTTNFTASNVDIAVVTLAAGTPGVVTWSGNTLANGDVVTFPSYRSNAVSTAITTFGTPGKVQWFNHTLTVGAHLGFTVNANTSLPSGTTIGVTIADCTTAGSNTFVHVTSGTSPGDGYPIRFSGTRCTGMAATYYIVKPGGTATDFDLCAPTDPTCAGGAVTFTGTASGLSGIHSDIQANFSAAYYVCSVVDADNFEITTTPGGPCISFRGSSTPYTIAQTFSTFPTGIVSNTLYLACDVGVHGVGTFTITTGTSCASAKQTFTGSTTDTIWGSDLKFTITNHGMADGAKVFFVDGGTHPPTNGSLPTGLYPLQQTGSIYVHVWNANQFSLYQEWWHATGGTTSTGVSSIPYYGGIDILQSTGNTSTNSVIDVTTTTYKNIATTCTRGGGACTGASGATLTIEINNNNGGQPVGAWPYSAGGGYQVGDVLAAAPSDIGGATGITFTVTDTGFFTSNPLGTSPTPSGYTPAFAFLSADGIGASGVGFPMEDLEFDWDCGDPTMDSFTNNLGTFNMNTDQHGMMAVCKHANAGTFNHTLTIKYWNGSAVATKTVIHPFTASNMASPTEYFLCPDPLVAPPGTGNGTSKATCWTSPDPNSHINAVLATNLNQVIIHHQRGSRFTTVGSYYGGQGANTGSFTHVRFDDCEDKTCATKWTGGALGNVSTQFETTNGQPPYLSTQTLNTDVVYTNLNFINSSGASSGQVCGAMTPLNNNTFIYTDHVTCTITGASVNSGAAGISLSGASDVGHWGLTYAGVLILQPTTGSNRQIQLIDGAAQYRHFMLGSDVSGYGVQAPSGAPGNSHVMYVQSGLRQGYYGYNYIHDASGLDNCLKWRNDLGGGDELVISNEMTGCGNGTAIGQSVGETPQAYYNIVHQGNWCHNMGGSGGNGLCFSGGDVAGYSWTVKFNRVSALGVTSFMEPNQNGYPNGEAAFLTAKTYGNRVFTDSANNDTTWHFLVDLTNPQPAGYPVHWAQKQYVLNNVWGTPSTAGATVSYMAMNWTDPGFTSATIDYNTYFHGNASPTPFVSSPNSLSFTSKSFTGVGNWQAQGWDVHGTLTTGNGCPTGWNCNGGVTGPTSWADFGP